MKHLLLLIPLLGLTFTAFADHAAPSRSLSQPPAGLSSSEWSSIRAAYEAGRHAFHPEDGHPGQWTARSPGQQWITRFDGYGFVAQAWRADWRWGLELKCYAVGSQRFSVGESGAGIASDNRLRFERGHGLTEWFVNDGRGLEQGWTIADRPAAGEGPVRLELAVRGDLSPVVSDSAVTFTNAAGAAVVTYGGLKAWDADGQDLAATFARSAHGIAVEVDASGARYPITIDPIAQQAYLKAHQVSAEDRFGWSVAVSGDTVVVGAYQEDSSTTGVNSTPNEAAAGSGAVYVFARSGTTWVQQAYLKAHQVSSGDAFGVSVAVSGNTIVAGAFGEDSSTTGANSSPNELASNAGAAYIFVRTGTTWSQQAYLKAPQVTAGDEFGYSVAVSGDTVVIGATREDSSTTGVNSTPNESASGSGAAYVFVRNGTTWTQQAYLKAHQVSAADEFGISVGVSGDTVVVGAKEEDSSTTGVNSTPNESATSSGAAYVFVRNGTAWTQQAYLKAHQVSADDYFGTAVAVSGDTVVAGAWGEDSGTTGIDSTPNESAAGSGATYVFVRSGTTWTQQAYLKAHQVTAGDSFGSAVALSGNLLVIGANREDSGTTGVDSTPNESATDAGAAYVFERSGTTWSQQAYAKAHQVSAGDLFGYSVAVSVGTVVIGAWGEDSNTAGVNSPPTESATDAGAAYIFSSASGPGASLVTNLTAAQRTGTKLVDITYDLAAPGFTAVAVGLQISSDGGATWTLPAVSVSGDIGASVAPGTGKTIVWDAGTDFPQSYSSQMRFRVTADDGVTPLTGFAYIPAGSFTMGRTSGDTDSDAPPVTVTVSGFYLQETETTKAQWDEVRTWGLSNGYTDLAAGAGKAASHPVNEVSWWDAVKWCNARSEKEGLTPVYTVSGAVLKTGTSVPTVNWSANGYRLPTEAEWEKAARGGVSGKRFPWGTDTISHAQANYFGSNSNAYDQSPINNFHPSYNDGVRPYTSPIGSFAANGFGLYSMSGNVWEWCWDWYGANYYGTSNGTTDPRGATSGQVRVFRGGSFNDAANYERCALRFSNTPGHAYNDIGLRPARGRLINDFVEIPGGAFTMGRTSGDSDSNAPPVTVTVSSFLLQETETTKAQWDEVRTWGLNNGYTDLAAGAGKAANHPVQTVSWWDVVKWCNARSEKEGLTAVYTVSGALMRTGTTEPTANWNANGYRLPTEAEWEKAARGGVSGKRFPWGTDTISHSQANFNNSGVEPYQSGTSGFHPTHATGDVPYTSPVGSFATNGFGLSDLAGNVWEWCWDYEGGIYTSGVTNPRGPASSSERVTRGGAWGSRAVYTRCSDRNSAATEGFSDRIGFRAARRGQ